MLKSPIFLAIVAYFLFAAQSVVLEQKLSRFTPGATLVVLYTTTIPLVIGRYAALKFESGGVTWPAGWDIAWVAVAGACYFFGDLVLIKAYTAAYEMQVGYLHSIVLVAVLFPIFAIAVKYGWTRDLHLPNKYHLGAFVLSGIVLYLVAKGQAQESAAAASTPTP